MKISRTVAKFVNVGAALVISLSLAGPVLAQGPPPARVKQAIMWAFCGHQHRSPCELGHEAIRVAVCESELNTDAKNGQYLGILQLGRWERKTYAHGHYSGPWEQAKAAYRYRVAVGHWSPTWSCGWAA